ncbi:MAG TPA: multiheme c-type cytochrome, partial [Terriglobales bacterium]|nr:multiheme c-type cytochrome [Terriglobales bacterium]
ETALTAVAENRRAQPAAPVTDFGNSHPAAIQCGFCHSEQFKDWSGSFHAQSLTSAGFLRSFPQYLEFIGKQPEADPQAAMACFNCHAPLLKHAGPEIIRQVSDWVRNKEINRLEGFEVGCVACHTDGNGAFSGPIRDPKNNPFHRANFSPSYRDASFCATCHTAKPSSIPCSDVYSDWKKSEAEKQGKSCQSCHMPEQSGVAGAGGPVRKISSHSFGGGRSAAMLQRAVTLRLKAAFQKDRLQVTATVHNLVPHRVPDG